MSEEKAAHLAHGLAVSGDFSEHILAYLLEVVLSFS